MFLCKKYFSRCRESEPPGFTTHTRTNIFVLRHPKTLRCSSPAHLCTLQLRILSALSIIFLSGMHLKSLLERILSYIPIFSFFLADFNDPVKPFLFPPLSALLARGLIRIYAIITSLYYATYNVCSYIRIDIV